MRDLRRIREKVIIRLEHRQVAMAIIGFIIVSVGTFSAGVIVGKQMSEQVPDSIAQLAGIDEVSGDLQSPREHRKRGTSLAQVHPRTGPVHAELVSGKNHVRPTDGTNAARIETHRQLMRARATGVARSLGTAPIGRGVAKAAEPVRTDHVRRQPEAERRAFESRAQAPKRFALQVSAFSALGPARTVATELNKTGHQAKVREVALSGRLSYRVEVGDFASAKAASRFQRTFERKSGYSTVMVPVL